MFLIILPNSKELQNIRLLCSLDRICYAIPLVLRTLPFFFFFFSMFMLFNFYSIVFEMELQPFYWILIFCFKLRESLVFIYLPCKWEVSWIFVPSLKVQFLLFTRDAFIEFFFLLIFIGRIIWMNRIPVFQLSIWLGLWYCAGL